MFITSLWTCSEENQPYKVGEDLAEYGKQFTSRLERPPMLTSKDAPLVQILFATAGFLQSTPTAVHREAVNKDLLVSIFDKMAVLLYHPLSKYGSLTR